MSFSREVKEELAAQLSGARHCRIAELAAILVMCGHIRFDKKKGYFIKIHTENLTVARKYFILLKNTFDVTGEVLIRRNKTAGNNTAYLILVRRHQDALTILKAVKLLHQDGKEGREHRIADSLVIQNTCCRRAYLRGAFLASGSISDPSRAYHFEIVVSSMEQAEQLKTVLKFFDVDAGIVLRKKYYVVYVKEGEQIVNLLNIMEAHVALMKLENVRILKEVRNSVNRKVNCETANINKTVEASSRQVADILYIRDTVGFGELSEGLREVAGLRIEQPDLSLKELGSMLSPPLGKSGVNHRLRKLGMIAEKLREQKEEKCDGNKKNGH